MRGAVEKMSADDSKKDKEQRQEIRLAKIAAGTIMLFIVSWISFAVFVMTAING